MNKSVSVIIPTFNAQNYIEKLLEKLKVQSIKDFELIVIDSSSKDDTVKIAKKYTNNVMIIPQKEFDHGGTRAKAAMKAKGEILVFLTQDSLPFDQHSIENLVKVFENKRIGAAYGKQISYETTNLFGKHLREFNYPDTSSIKNKNDIKVFGVKTAQLSNSFAAYRKSILEEVGMFKDNLILGEDVYTGGKMILAGYSLAYISDAIVYHSHSYSIEQEFKRYFDIGVFHKKEGWILNEFGKAEGEGMKYVNSEIRYLFSHGAWYLLPEFFIRNCAKYLGYKLGQKYKKLPRWSIKKCSMHHKWWDKYI